MEVNQAQTKIMQVNLGRGAAATTVAQVVGSDYDFICIQEPCGTTILNSWKGKCIPNSNIAKVRTIVHKKIDILELQEFTSLNIVAISIGNHPSSWILVNVYAEKTGSMTEILRVLSNLIHSYPIPLILVGDFNAHHPLWGSPDMDNRGEQLLAFMVANRLDLLNKPELGPTFQTIRAEGYIDLSMARDIGTTAWTILEDDSLSDHKIISISIKLEEEPNSIATRFNWKRANWHKFKESILSSISQIDKNSNAEIMADKFQALCLSACKLSMKQVGQGTRPSSKVPSWWTRSLSDLRRKTAKARKKFQRRTTQNREVLKQSYRLVRQQYKSAIKLRKAESWREYCDVSSRRDPFSMPYKILAGKNKPKSSIKSIKRADGSWTESVDQTMKELLTKYFPQDSTCDDSPEHTEMRQRAKELYFSFNDKNFTEPELKKVVLTMDVNRSPGLDGFPVAALRELLDVCIEDWLFILNKCLKEGVFPKIWKKSLVVWIPKGDGNSFRPICLLPVIGKVLDKLCAGRLSHFLEVNNCLSTNQFGFRKQKNTSGAISGYISHVNRVKQDKLHSLAIMLDISNAFNSAWYPIIANQLREVKCPKNIRNLIVDFLSDRTAKSGNIEISTNRGCPQGSCLGPILWILLMETWFTALNPILGNRDLIQAFADDSLGILVGSSMRIIERKWITFWDKCCIWAFLVKLSYNKEKTKMIFHSAKNVGRDPRVRIDNQIIVAADSVLYLGVMVDPKFYWLHHVKYIQGKVMAIALKLIAITGKKWGVKPDMLKAIYERAIIPMMLYGAEIWGSRAHDTRIQRKLNAMQRPFLLAICRAYRTTPNSAIQVLSGCPPLYLLAKKKYEIYLRRSTSDNLDSPIEVTSFPHPSEVETLDIQNFSTEIEEENDYLCYTDGSKLDGKVGLAIVLIRDNITFNTQEARLPDECSVFQAELQAIKQAVDWQSELMKAGESIAICSDAKSALDVVASGSTDFYNAFLAWTQIKKLRSERKHISLCWIKAHVGHRGNEQADENAKLATVKADITPHRIPRSYISKMCTIELYRDWQNQWDIALTGRTVYRSLSNVKDSSTPINGKLVHLLTGHGPFNQYLNRFNLGINDPSCECGDGIDDFEHILNLCSLPSRNQARNRLADSCVIERLVWNGSFKELFSQGKIKLLYAFANMAVLDY